MSDFDALLDALEKITGTGHFCSTGHAPFFFPELEVDEVGEIAFPMVEAQVRELIGRAEKAPYGQGEKTVNDERVRKCWQLDEAEFRFRAKAWTKYLKGVVEQVREHFGIEGRVSAHPYKLLIYGKGGHFKAHRDTEKLDAMFGTLIVALPSAHEGGQLRVRHEGNETVVDFSDPAHRYDFQHAAFFADCEHEVEAVKSGYRCCVVYNLRLIRGDPAALNCGVNEQAKRLEAPLAELGEARRGDLSAVLMEHQYTEANFALRQLKGHDWIRARALMHAAKAVGLRAHLGLVTHYQSGELEGSVDRYGGRHWDDEPDDDGEMGEIYEESRRIGSWRDGADRAVSLGDYSIDDDPLISRRALNEGEPDEKESEGYTGNAGCTMDYWYRRAAVVLWCREDEEEILCRYDFRGACRKLVTLARRGGAAFRRLAEAVLARLPDHVPHAGHRLRRLHWWANDDDPIDRVLAALAEAGAEEHLQRLLETLPVHAWLFCEGKTWKSLLRTFGAKAFDGFANRLREEQEDEQCARSVLFDLLAALRKTGDAAALARRIAAHLVRLDPLASPNSDGGADPAEARALLTKFSLLDQPDERSAARDFLCADGSLDHVRAVLGPVLVEKSSSLAAAGEVRKFAIRVLAEEVARPLVPFPDWTRSCPADNDDEVSLNWPYRPRRRDSTATAFNELRDFMTDPEREQCDLRYPEGIRNALEGFIKQHALDLDTRTVRQGRPYGLVCKKNDRSYRRVLKRRAEDEKLLKALQG